MSFPGLALFSHELKHVCAVMEKEIRASELKCGLVDTDLVQIIRRKFNTCPEISAGYPKDLEWFDAKGFAVAKACRI